MKIVTISITILVVALSIALIWVIYTNFGGEKTNQTLIKVGGLIAAALILLSYEMFSTNNELSKSVKLFIPRDEYRVSADVFYKKLRYQNPERAKGYEIMSQLFPSYEKYKTEDRKRISKLISARISNDPVLKAEEEALTKELSELRPDDPTQPNFREELKEYAQRSSSEHKKFHAKVRKLISDEDDQFRYSDDSAMDLLELTFWTWLSKKYSLHWQVIYTDNYGISGWGGSTTEQSEHAEKNPKIISLDEAQDILKFKLLPGHFTKLTLPENTQMKVVERSPSRRVFEIKTKNLTLKVTIRDTGKSPIRGTKLGDAIISKTTNAPQAIEHYRVNFETKLKRKNIFSSETERQKKWVKELQQDFYNDFDWSVIKPDLEKAYLP
jgi:hypothetical protein